MPTKQTITQANRDAYFNAVEQRFLNDYVPALSSKGGFDLLSFLADIRLDIDAFSGTELAPFAGAGLVVNGTTIDVNVDDVTVEINSDVVRVKDAGITRTKLGIIENVFLGTPIVATVDRIVTAVTLANGVQTLAGQPDCPRNITVKLTDANSSVTVGRVTVVGLDPSGASVTETFDIVSAGGTQTITGVKIFASVTSVTNSSVAGAAAGDDLEVGVGNVIGLPNQITASTAVKHVYLGGVRQAAPTIPFGTQITGIDASAGTYDGTKALMAVVNIGQ